MAKLMSLRDTRRRAELSGGGKRFLSNVHRDSQLTPLRGDLCACKEGTVHPLVLATAELEQNSLLLPFPLHKEALIPPCVPRSPKPRCRAGIGMFMRQDDCILWG